MCGRYILTAPAEEIGRIFAATAPPLVARYNIAPTQMIPVVRQLPGPGAAEGRIVEMMRWGLVPGWVTDPAAFTLLINARAETAASKPAFRAALRRRRAIVPASGFYEWRAVGTGKARVKQPFLIRPRSGGVMAFAALYEERAVATGEIVASAAILTTTANATLAPIHDRMPVILDAADFAAWLDAEHVAVEAVAPLLRPAADDLLESWPVSRRVNAARDDDPGLMEPVAL